MNDAFIGEIIMFGGNFAPRNWAFCQGQLLAISQNQSLFSILGTTYGGDGRTTFGLPDLRGRVPISSGSGPGLRNHTLGEKGGTETNQLVASNLPPIPLKVSSADAAQSVATAGSSIATPGTVSGRTFTPSQGFNTSSPDVTLNGASVQGGSSAPVNNIPPYQVINFIICLEGIYPSRS